MPWKVPTLNPRVASGSNDSRRARISPAALLVKVTARIAHAALLVIATPDAFDALKMLEIARTLNPAIEAVLRTHSEEEAALLQREAAGMVFLGENELARGMAQHVLARMGRADAGSSAH